ncbi:MAG TPA: orotate phosphoribosyltransferase [SAR86 cluster bacterium]|jgi:orotate phosphoribosyltransferase|nr:orotate phosphoribosyltransferase [SAR86 cluster bacterium]HJM15097.1 orotate phosphoribosyltransferase [SAR86 cluster bacterium]|tara:strand:+ start:3584 stop:4213 length:630 start_codon:yes stop_codon:yes gene_type:complete
MKDRENNFFELAIKAEALLLGDFTLKSGRKSPYFFNISSFFELGFINELSNLYANLIEEEEIQFDVIFGPAYKGIPLAAAVATIISGRTSNLISISFDRKEEKTHGEGGKIVGSVAGKKVLILDDVLTAGTALNQSIELVRGMGGEVVSSLVALDREELVGGVLARDLIGEKTNSKLLSIATISQLVDFFNQTNKTKEAQLIEEYLSKQ